MLSHRLSSSSSLETATSVCGSLLTPGSLPRRCCRAPARPGSVLAARLQRAERLKPQSRCPVERKVEDSRLQPLFQLPSSCAVFSNLLFLLLLLLVRTWTVSVTLLPSLWVALLTSSPLQKTSSCEIISSSLSPSPADPPSCLTQASETSASLQRRQQQRPLTGTSCGHFHFSACLTRPAPPHRLSGPTGNRTFLTP